MKNAKGNVRLRTTAIGLPVPLELLVGEVRHVCVVACGAHVVYICCEAEADVGVGGGLLRRRGCWQPVLEEDAVCGMGQLDSIV